MIDGFSLCLFCASSCSTNFAVVDGRVQRVKKELLIIPDQFESEKPSSLEFGEEDVPIQENLQRVFILRNILKVETELLCQFLSGNDEDCPPERWFAVCQSCGVKVRQYYDSLKEIKKLERKLMRIETELKGNIFESRETLGGSVWAQIRNIVVNAGTSENLPIKNEQKDPFQGLETLEYNEMEIDEEFKVRTYHLNENGSITYKNHSTALSTSQSSGEDDNADVEEPPPKKLSKEELKEKYFGKPPVPKEKIKQYMDGMYPNRCTKCPYGANNMNAVVNHMRLVHAKGSDSSPCPDCGAYVITSRLSQHRSYHRYQIRREDVKGRGTKRHNLDESNPDYISYSFPLKKSRQYECRKCPYRTGSRKCIPIHVKVHADPSAIACGECGVVVEKAKLNHHLSLRHDITKHKVKTTMKSSRFVANCKECPYKTGKSSLLKIHMKLHQEGSESSKCEECGWFVLDDQMARHRSKLHGLMGEQGRKRKAGRGKLYYFKCPDCGALLSNIGRYREHELLHSEGNRSKYDICDVCGWLCIQMYKHKARWHPTPDHVIRHKYDRDIKLMPKRIQK